MIVFAVVMMVSGISCTSKQPVTDASYINFKVGNEWKYQISSSAETIDDSGKLINHDEKPAVITFKITGEEEVDGKKCFVKENMVRDKFNPKEYYQVDPAVGVNLCKQGFIIVEKAEGKKALFSDKTEKYIQSTFNPPQLVMKFPLNQGQNWVRKIDRGSFVDQAVFIVKGIESVETPAGKFEALKIESSGGSSAGGGEFTARQWYAPNVGLIKETVEAKSPDGRITSETILKEYKPAEGGKK
jgi:hypothetical protein